MTELIESPAMLMLTVAFLISGSLVVLAWGRRLPRQGDWLLGVGLLGLLIVSGVGWTLMSERGFAPEEWLRGWIWPREEPGAITVGVVRDTLALSWVTLAGWVAAATLIAATASRGIGRPARLYAAMGFSTAGVSVAWFALTPWFALAGVALAAFGGFLALGERWEDPIEAELAIRFGWERSWGLLLALLGLCVLAGDRAPLLLHGSGAGAWAPQPKSSDSDFLGAVLLFLGACAQLQPFPLLGWVMRPSMSHSPSRTVGARVFPAWAAFALLVRLEPQFRDIGVFPHLGWLGIASCVLAGVAGLLSTEWRLGLGAWISTGLSLSVAVLAFAGPGPALCLAIGMGLGACALSGFASALEAGGPSSPPGRQRALWAKIGCGLAACAGTGFIGFVSAGGGARALSLVWNEPAIAGALGFAVFFLGMLGWKVAYQGMAAAESTQASWASVLSPYLVVLVAFGVLWTGTLSGGALPGDPDRLFGSLLSKLFGAPGEAWGAEESIAPASAVYWVLVLLSIGVGYWTAGKRADSWARASRSMPRLSAFVGSGYGIDTVFARVRQGLSAVGALSVRVLDRGVWQSWMPGALGAGARRGAAVIAIADLRLSRGIGGMLRRWVEAPSKALQLIQNGDVQWYLFFAVGSGIAILAHFMRA